MRLTFNPLPRSLAGILGCWAFLMAAATGVEARGAIVFDTNPNSQAALVRWLSSKLVIDWNEGCKTQELTGVEDEQSADLPSLTPDDYQSAAIDEATDEAATVQNVKPAADAAEMDASDDQDYLEYKYGRYGRYFGNSSMEEGTAQQSSDDSTETDDVAALDESTKTGGSAESDDSMKTDDSIAAEESTKTDDSTETDDAVAMDESANSGDSNEADDSMKSDEPIAAEESTKTDDSTETDDAVAMDESANSGDSTEADDSMKSDEPIAAEESTTDESIAQSEAAEMPDDDSVVAEDNETKRTIGETDAEKSSRTTFEQYYKYRYESLEEPEGNDAGLAAQDDHGEGAESPEGYRGADEGAEAMASNEEGSSEEAVSHDEDGHNSGMADAMFALISRWTNEIAETYGLSPSQFARLVRWFR